MAAFPGLDRYDAMQRMPFGTFTAMNRPNPVATQYKRQSEMYGQALRNLSRAARRGDLNAGQEAIKLREQANASEFAPGGISRAEDFQGNVARRAQTMEQETADLATKSELDRRNADMTLGRTPMTEQPVAAPTRISAGLDMLEGRLGGDGTGPEVAQFDRGRETALTLGVKNPENILAGDTKLKYRRTLDTALGQAKTPEEVAALKERGTKFGISPSAFDRRAKWWDSNR